MAAKTRPHGHGHGHARCAALLAGCSGRCCCCCRCLPFCQSALDRTSSPFHNSISVHRSNCPTSRPSKTIDVAILLTINCHNTRFVTRVLIIPFAVSSRTSEQKAPSSSTLCLVEQASSLPRSLGLWKVSLRIAWQLLLRHFVPCPTIHTHTTHTCFNPAPNYW